MATNQERARKRVVIYTRVSRDDTGEGKSNDRQEAECRRLAEYKRWTVVAVERDVSKSAYSGKVRPAWRRVLEMVEAREVDIVVAWHIDRMTRSMLDLEALISLAVDRDIGIATVTGDIDLTNETGQMVARILAAVARAESDRKAARQRLANEQRAAAGIPHISGVRPFGYEADHMTVIAAEADAIRDGAQRALDGESMASIGKRWSRMGLVSARAKGKRGWTARGVRGVLTNYRYAGIRMYNGRQMGQAAWDPVLDVDTFLRLNEMFTDPARKKGENAGRTGRKPQTLLAGIESVTCIVCDGKLRGSSVRDRLTYGCTPGNHVTPNRDEADNLVAGFVVDRLSRPDAVLLMQQPPETPEETAARLKELDEALKSAARMFGQGHMSEEEYRIATAETRRLLDEAEAQSARPRSTPRLPLQGLDLGTDKIAKQWEELSLERQRALIAGLCRVTVRPQGRSRKGKVAIEDQITVVDLEEGTQADDRIDTTVVTA